jgi:hypothetical protein
MHTRLLILTITIFLVSSATVEAGCYTNLSYLDSMLPRYNDPEVEGLRQQILNTDLNQALAAAQSQGLSPSQAVSAALQQADQYDAAAPSAEQCILQSAAGDPDAIMNSLDSGTYSMGSGGILWSCAKAYVIWRMGAIANREAAVGLACLAQ